MPIGWGGGMISSSGLVSYSQIVFKEFKSYHVLSGLFLNINKYIWEDMIMGIPQKQIETLNTT